MYLVTSSFLSIQSSSDLNGILVSQMVARILSRHFGSCAVLFRPTNVTLTLTRIVLSA